MKIARHSFVPPIKDVTAASQGVNSKWGLALPSAVRSHNDLYFSCLLPPLSRLPPPSVILHLSLLCLPVLLKTSPLVLDVLTRLSHSDATRGKLMCPGPRRSITACDGTSAFALYGIHRSAWCGEEIKKKKKKSTEAPRRIPGQLLLQCWWAVMCLCHSTVVKSKVRSVQVAPLLIAAVSPDCHRSAPGATRGPGGAQPCNPAWTFQPGQFRGNSHAE